ncbi:MAG: DUF4153 domain-containing protein [bacterium]|nr:DUF4153 domain-containing protein [bacterium]
MTIYAWKLVEATADTDWQVMTAGILALLLSLVGPLLSMHLFDEGKRARLRNSFAQVLALLLGIGYYFMIFQLPDDLTYAEGLVLGGVFLLAVVGILTLLAWIFRQREEKIWFSWTTLLQSLVFGALAGAVVWGGLSGALGSIEALFDVDVHRRWYQYFGVFGMIFLAGSFALNHYTFAVTDLPKGSEEGIVLQDSRVRRIFGAYIFLPLAMVYLAIFLAYGAKILMTGVRPKGIIVWLGIGYFSLGMLTYYFTFPEQKRFFELMHKVLFGSFIVIAVMMIAAIGMRINQYGLTINRYFIVMMITFIVLFSALAIMFPKIRLRLFASLLLGMSIVALYGPLSAPKMAFRSQVARIEELLEQQQLSLPLEKGALEGVDKEFGAEISELFDELAEKYPAHIFVPRVIANSADFQEEHIWSRGRAVREYLGLADYYTPTEDPDAPIDFRINSYGEDRRGISVEGFKRYYQLYHLDAWIDAANVLRYEIDATKYELDLSPYVEDIFSLSSK